MPSLKHLLLFLSCVCLVSFGITQLPAQGPVPLSCDAVGSNAFIGCYYNDADFTDLRAVRTDPIIYFDWGLGSPDPFLGEDHFSVRWQGDFQFPISGTYRFYTGADDGLRLYLDNTLILDRWSNHGATAYPFERFITRGTHQVKVEYFDDTDASIAKVVWAAPSDSPKGLWGRVKPIADNNHPNLFYNQSEIDELRRMILVERSPQHLYDLYNSRFKNISAILATKDYPAAQVEDYHYNMRAAVSYMVEPTSAKADAIRESLLSYVSGFPSGLPEWSAIPGVSFSGYVVPWMFDLMMAYHPEKLSSLERRDLKKWFALSADGLRFIADRKPNANVYDGQGLVWTEGTKTIQNLPNWFNRYMGPSLACALLSGDQELVDFWVDSGWPHDLFRTEIVTPTFPTLGTNRFDLVSYLLSVFPSGANTDSYVREGYRSTDRTWYTTDYSWGAYHFAQMYGSILGAEMAYHNGMTGVFALTDVQGTEPGLLRTFKRAIESRTETDRQPANPTGRPIIGWDPAIFAGYRRYADPAIANAIPGVLSYSGPIPGGIGGSLRGFDVPGDVWQIFGYPRRIAWTAGAASSVSSVTVGSAIVLWGAGFSVDFSGSNLNDQTYFDVRFRAPGDTTDQEVFNWQRGTSFNHLLSANTPVGTWTITGVRAHQEENDHTGIFTPVSAVLSVAPF
jgi:hypothetical protein